MEAKTGRKVSVWENTLLLSHPSDRALLASPQLKRTSSRINFYPSTQAQVNFYQTNYISKLMIIIMMNINES